MNDLLTRLRVALEGRYRVERLLGEGGMATVYLAHDIRHRKTYRRALDLFDSVIHICLMGHTISVRLPKELAEWLEETATSTGVSQGQIIREQLERAMAGSERPFMRLAGSVKGPADLSTRKGFSQS